MKLSFNYIYTLSIIWLASYHLSICSKYVCGTSGWLSHFIGIFKLYNSLLKMMISLNVSSHGYFLNLECTDKMKCGDLKSQGYSPFNFLTSKFCQAACPTLTDTLHIFGRPILFKTAELVSKTHGLCLFFCIILSSINFTVFIYCFIQIRVSFNLYSCTWTTTYWNAGCWTRNILGSEWY